MKRHRLASLIAGLSLLMGPAAQAAVEFTVARGGQAAATIVLLPDSGKAAELAAADLAATLKTMSGAVFPVTYATAGTPCIVVGLASGWARLMHDEAPLKRLADASPESFVIQSASDRLLILGKDGDGASHGVYTLLRDLGCRWFFPAREWDAIPRRADIAVTADRVEGPAMKVRILSNGAGAGAAERLFAAWCRRNRLGSCYGPSAVHHSYAGYVPRDLFKEHPDYFARVSKDGVAPGTEQNGNQPCTTHPEVVKRVCEGVLDELRRRKAATGETPLLVSVSPNDGTTDLCRCPRCMATGTYGDCALLLANQAAEAIQAEFPGTRVGFLAYGRAGALPVRVRQAHSNVLASVATSYNWKTSVPRLITEWPKIVRHVTVYEYYAIGSWGAQEPDNSLPNLAAVSQTLRDWQRQGIEGVNGEMENDWASCGLRLWAFTQFAWDPALAPAAVMDDFLSRCWGESAGPMQRYYERWESGQRASPRVLRLAFRDLEEAARLARSPEVARRVDQMSLYLYWYWLTREFKEARDDDARNRIALEGDLFQYRWRNAFMVQLNNAIFNVDRPVKLGFAPAEVAALRAGALKRDLPAAVPEVDVGGAVWSEDLVPARTRIDVAAFAAAPREQPYLEAASYVFRAKAGEPVEVMFEPEGSVASGLKPEARPVAGEPAEAPGAGRDALPAESAAAESLGRFQVWYLGNAGADSSFVQEENPPAAGGKPWRLTFTVPRDGLYRLNVKARKGGLWAGFQGRPFVLAAEVKPRKNVLRAEKASARPAEGQARKPAQTRYCFYVPKGTACFLLDAAVRGRASVKAALEAANGGAVTNVTVETARECLITVPAGRDGAVWSVTLDGERGCVALGGIPPYVAMHPDDLLIPAETSVGRERR